ncbi:MAG TPA: ABC transporter substrate-binding protein [Planctomycetota bacterium]|nr:ABC transporter substrate-binding protein [Planctomycetota bacterium]
MKSGACPFSLGILCKTGVFTGKATLMSYSVLLLGLLLALGCRPRPETLHIGIPLRLTGEKGPGGRQLLRAMKMRVDELNARGGLGGQRIALDIQDLGTSPETGKKAIQALATDVRIAAIVGLDDPEMGMVCGAVCGQEKIPVVLPTVGDAGFLSQNPCLFTLTRPLAFQAEAIAAHLATFWKASRVALLHEETTTAGQMAESFRRLAGKLNIQITDVAYRAGSAVPAPERLASTTEGCQAIVLFDESARGASIIRALRDLNIQVPIFGSDMLAGGIIQALGNESYLQDLYVPFPFMYELADRPAIDFYRNYTRTYHESPAPGAAFAYDAISLLSRVIETVGPERANILQGLKAMDNPERAFDGVTGLLYFTPERFVPHAPVVAQVVAGAFKPAFRQLRRVEDAFSLRTLDRRMRHGFVEMIDSVPYFKIEVIYVGIDFQRLNEVNVREKKFGMNLILWFRWTGDTKTDDIEFTNALGEVERTPIASDLEQPVKWAAYRVRGTFTCSFDLHNYPFDRQELSLAMASRIRNGHRIQLVFNQRSVNPRLDEVIPGDWLYEGREDYAGNFTVSSTFGYPGFRPGEKMEPFSQVHTIAFVRRNVFPYFVTVFIPLGVIVVTTLLLNIFLSRHQYGSKVSVSTTSLLSVLVFQLTQDSTLPQLGYVTLVDRLFMVTYFFMCAFIANDVVVNHLAAHLKRETQADALDRWGKVALATIAVTAYGAVLLPVLTGN